MGPTNPANYLKINAGNEKRHQYVYEKIICSPCVHRYEKLPCGGNNVCMQQISAEQVIEKISDVLNHLAHPSPQGEGTGLRVLNA
jgi:hypothetical protein